LWPGESSGRNIFNPKAKGKERINITDFEDRRRTNVYNSSRRKKKKGTLKRGSNLKKTALS